MKVVGPCIEHDGYRNAKGYGQVRIGGRNGKTWLAHRWAWAQVHGDPGDLCVLHACDNPACINIDHLFLGTRADNNHDMIAKGRYTASMSLRTHCPRGHEYDMTTWKGGRWCRRCQAMHQRNYIQRKKASCAS